jgi:trimeric autotransporter adhesin
MIAAIRRRLTYSNTIATLALFIALGGAAVAAGLPRNSVGTKQLKRRAVTAAKLAPKSVVSGKIGPNAVGPGNIGNGAVTTAKLAQGSVIASTIKNGVVTTNKLTNEAVTTAKLANGSVTAAKLGGEVGPLLGTLKAGQTLRGTLDVGGTATVGGELARGGVSYQFPLLNAATATVLKPGQTSPNCAGVSGGNNQTPQATGGNLCIYVTSESNLDETTPLAVENNLRLGFGLAAKAKAAGEYFAVGQWAVTAP